MDILNADFSRLLFWLDLIGIYVFGLSGAMLAVRRKLDLFGIIVLSTAAATAGGAIRDIAIGDHPAAVLREPLYLATTFVAGLTGFFAYRLIDKLNKPVMLLDALGLGLFTVAGTQKALAFGLHPAAACVIGVITAVGGGVIRDILVAEIPRVLREDIYAVAAIFGAVIVVGGTYLGWPSLAIAVLGIGVTFIVRVLSVRFDLRMPRAR